MLCEAQRDCSLVVPILFLLLFGTLVVLSNWNLIQMAVDHSLYMHYLLLFLFFAKREDGGASGGGGNKEHMFRRVVGRWQWRITR